MSAISSDGSTVARTPAAGALDTATAGALGPADITAAPSVGTAAAGALDTAAITAAPIVATAATDLVASSGAVVSPDLAVGDVAGGLRFSPPEGVAIRGTVIVVVGRGESPAVYPRFGQRLAADGYVVAVPDPASAGFIDGHTAQEVARGTEALVAAVHRERDTPGRVVVVGSDTGAWWALLAAAATSQVAGVVAVGLPLRASHDRLDWDAELEVRTACPVHRARLDDTQTLARDALAVVPEALRTAGSAVTVGVPILVLHGEQDQISPWRDAVALARTWPTARAVTVADGRHDVLNDLAHRSVAAEIVQLLERLRLDPAAPPILLDHP